MKIASKKKAPAAATKTSTKRASAGKKNATSVVSKKISKKIVAKKTTQPKKQVRNNDTMSQSPFTVVRSITLQAAPAEVWDALTNPEKTKQYFFNCEVFSTWVTGSPITFKGRVMLVKKIEMHGTIVQAEPEKVLKYTLQNDHGDGTSSTSTVTDRLSYANNQTTLTITDHVGDGEGAQERYNRSEKGWDKVLKGLKKLLEQ